MIFDTDVLIWCLRGNERATAVIQSASKRAVSVITCMELFQGARNRQELAAIRAFLKAGAFTILPVTASISQLAMDYVEGHNLSSSIGVTDALIAATAVEHADILCSGNTKHYRPIGELRFQEFRPGK